jgi:hypothetical protein
MAGDISWNEVELERLLNSEDGPVGDDLRRRALNVEAAGKRLLSQHGSGRIYRKYKPRRIHQASAPGEPPAPDTGLLRASLGHEVGQDADGLYADIGYGVNVEAGVDEGDTSIADIAEYLEVGTRHMEARPFLRPALLAADGEHEV